MRRTSLKLVQRRAAESSSTLRALRELAAGGLLRRECKLQATTDARQHRFAR